MTAAPELTGFSIIAGETAHREQAVGADAFRAYAPQTGRALDPPFHPATDTDVDDACAAAWTAFAELQARPPEDLARLLDSIADNMRALGTFLIATVAAETGLQTSRVESERDRAVYTLRLFADVARRADWTDAIIDLADPHRAPRPRPDLRRALRPLGPAAVFGASNFPLAYGVPGGDTASALAAGCPVVIKGHPAHPATGELIARAISDAVQSTGLPAGVFSYLVAGGRREHAIGERLIANPCIRAVGFTGSYEGGMAIAELSRRRPDPVPVYAEMGSCNPVVLLENALAENAEAIADDLARAILGSSGQQCTCPGLIFARRNAATERFIDRLEARMGAVEAAPMLSPHVRATYMRRVEQTAAIRGVDLRVGEAKSPPRPPLVGRFASSETGPADPITAKPAIFSTDAITFRQNATLHDESCGPSTLLVLSASETEFLNAIASVQGALVGAIYRSRDDQPLADTVRSVLEQRVGRLVFNGVTTGVEVAHAMVQGGPFPSTNHPETSAVGHTAIRRWARPVCYQNADDAALPPVLRDANPLGAARLVNGLQTREPLSRPV